MIDYIICFFVGVFFLAASFFLFLLKYKKKNISLGIKFLCAGMICSMFFLIVPFYINCSENIFDGIISSLIFPFRVVVVQDSYKDIIENVVVNSGSSLIRAYQIIIGLLFILLPVGFTGFILTFFESYISVVHFKLCRRFHDVYIFSELNKKSLLLAQSVDKEDSKSFVVFCNVNKYINQELIQVAKNCRFIVLELSEVELVKFSKYKQFFFEVADDEIKNLKYTKLLLTKIKQNQKIMNALNRVDNVKIFLKSGQKSAEVALNSINKQEISVLMIDINKLISYNLIFENPLYQVLNKNQKQISMLIVGAGNVGLEILKSALWAGQLGKEYKLKINVIDKNAKYIENNLRLCCPEIFESKYDVSFFEADVTQAQFEQVLSKKCSDANYIVVSLGDDELGLKTSLYLRGFYLRCDKQYKNEPFIAVQISDDIQAESVPEFTAVQREKIDSKNWKLFYEQSQNYNIKSFGSLGSTYSINFWIDSLFEKLSFNTHCAYERIFDRSQENFLQKCKVSYNYSEVNKRSNRANALHIRYKLFLLGFEIVQEKYATDEQKENSALCLKNLKECLLKKNEIDKLSQVEHDRWNAFHATDGWRGATYKQVQAYSKVTGSHKFIRANIHGCLCSWESLDKLVENFDPDFKRYDVEFIMSIPAILELENESKYKAEFNLDDEKFILVKHEVL